MAQQRRKATSRDQSRQEKGQKKVETVTNSEDSRKAPILKGKLTKKEKGVGRQSPEA